MRGRELRRRSWRTKRDTHELVVADCDDAVTVRVQLLEAFAQGLYHDACTDEAR